MILSKCAICGSKKSNFIKKKEAKELLSNLGIRTPLSKTPLLYKMNNIINKFLLTAHEFMPETHLKDLKAGTYSACGPFTRHKDRINKLFKQVIQTIYTKMN